jgi:hypothetical protein
VALIRTAPQSVARLWEHNPEERFPNISVPVLFMPAVGSGEAAWAVDKKEAVARALELLPKAQQIGTNQPTTIFMRSFHNELHKNYTTPQ